MVLRYSFVRMLSATIAMLTFILSPASEAFSRLLYYLRSGHVGVLLSRLCWIIAVTSIQAKKQQTEKKDRKGSFTRSFVNTALLSYGF